MFGCFSIWVFSNIGNLVFLDISGVWKCKCLNVDHLNVCVFRYLVILLLWYKFLDISGVWKCRCLDV